MEQYRNSQYGKTQYEVTTYMQPKVEIAVARLAAEEAL